MVLKPKPNWSLRLADSERRLLEAAALERGERLSQYVRRVSLAAARRDLAPNRSPDNRLEADLLHHCSCAVHETMSAGGMLELAEGHIAQARRLLDILQERARGIARVLAMYRPADEAPANAKGENSP
jgi:hypothetical protein